MRKPVAPLTRLGQRFFSKLPAPENEHGDGRQNDDRLPDGNVKEIEDLAMMLTEPDQTTYSKKVQDLNGNAGDRESDES